MRSTPPVPDLAKIMHRLESLAEDLAMFERTDSPLVRKVLYGKARHAADDILAYLASENARPKRGPHA